MNIEYKEKYLKYKNKYLKYKGGTVETISAIGVITLITLLIYFYNKENIKEEELGENLVEKKDIKDIKKNLKKLLEMNKQLEKQIAENNDKQLMNEIDKISNLLAK